MFRLVLVTALLCYFVGAADLPSFITACRQKDKNLEECAVKEANKVIAILAKGVPEIGFPSLIKYEYPNIVYNGPEAIITYHGGIATGLDGMVVDTIRFDFENNIIYSNLRIPTLELDGTYDIDGKIFDTLIKATGPFKISMENVDFVYKMKFEIFNKNGVDYLRKLAQTVRLEPQTVRVNFEKLFSDAEKTAKFNQQINDHKERCVKEIVPSVAEMVDNYLHVNIYEKMSNHVPYNQIFLQD